MTTEIMSGNLFQRFKKVVMVKWLVGHMHKLTFEH